MYPSNKELDAIRNHPANLPEECLTLLSIVKCLWHPANWGWNETEENDGGTLYTYSISTGGWSGNEDIVDAMQANTIFWNNCWYSSIRGGHYKFQFYEEKR